MIDEAAFKDKSLESFSRMCPWETSLRVLYKAPSRGASLEAPLESFIELHLGVPNKASLRDAFLESFTGLPLFEVS